MRIVFYFNMNAGCESLGIESLSSVLKANGHDVHLVLHNANYLHHMLSNVPLMKRAIKAIENAEEEKVVKEIMGYNPDILCFSVFTDNYSSTLRIAEIIKRRIPNLITVFGGMHCTSVPEEVIKNGFINYVMVGECEEPIIELVESIEGRRPLEKVSNLVYRNGRGINTNPIAPYIRNLDDLPLPDKDIFYDKIPALSNDYYIMTGRGCPHACTYCGNSVLQSMYGFEKTHLRRRSIHNVIKELTIAKASYKIGYISFLDDVFTLNPKDWLYSFLEEYIEKINLPYFCQIHPNHYSSEMGKFLAKSNCWNVTIGIQSGSARIREDVYRRKTTDKKIIDVCADMKKENLYVQTDIMFEAPTEEKKDIDITVEMMEKIMPSRISVYFLAFYPNTEMFRRAKGTHDLPSNVAKVYMEGAYSQHYLLKQPGEITPQARNKFYHTARIKLQLLCLLRRPNIARHLYGIVEVLPMEVALILSKVLTLLSTLINLDKRAFQRLRLLFGKKRLPI